MIPGLVPHAGDRNLKMKPYMSIILSLALLYAAGCASTSTLIKEPPSKGSISGFVHIASTWGNDFEPAEPQAIANLAAASNRYTNIRAAVDDHLLLDSRRIFQYPFIYIGVDGGFRPTQHEIDNLGEYLRAGGFALIENMQVGSSEGKGSLKQLVKSALGRQVME